MNHATFKVISSHDPQLLEQRLNDFIATLDEDDLLVEVSFSTAASVGGVEYSALVQYKRTEGWD